MLIWFFTPVLIAQQHIERQIDLSSVQHININANKSFKVQVKTNNTTRAEVTLKSEGEYGNQLALITTIKNDTLYISSEFQPLFKVYDDKLAAHKVTSLELDISLPQEKEVYLKSDIANVFCKGEFNRLVIELVNGQFHGDNIIGNATINTIRGNIYIQTIYTEQTHFKSQNRSSKTIVNKTFKQTLNSINGSIFISKIE
ncbi:hypothetical protein [Mangrovimonas spongiae]|uniref:Adhesin domain-containing protein n=1 Tax=Mangrovimonas spongiae TaxID=2494697 RepID=A0A428K5J6_9FLAO|nr:hypothetical protein [Mangrovimonas spongiae]RSK41708.1 hypothetical protein EJA19_02180 [Mangrovimonas spongiae]